MKKSLLLSLIFLSISTGHSIFGQNPDTLNRIVLNGKPVFLSGMNLAWISFANDLSNFNQSEFTRALNEIESYHGNALRWWLHINGTKSPLFIDGKVSGLGQNDIANVKRALDLAMEKGIVISLCLWSFDMLQSGLGEDVVARNLEMLENEEHLQAYIDNALIPMVDSLKGHPAILCWEVFNEPEGMASDANPWSGWTPTKVSFQYIQRFINRVSGAIHRTDSNALVSSGAWNVAVHTDITWTGGIPNSGNLYREDRLIEAGGDSLGTLDFYMIHYYDDHGMVSSPFHHSASYWELNKPIVVAEFSANGPYGDDISPTEAYNYLYNNGYAGALSWTWTGHDGNGGIEDAGPAMQDLFDKYPDDLMIDFGEQVNRTPYPVKTIPNIAIPVNFLSDTDYVDLKTIFNDIEQGPDLIYSIESNTDTNLVKVEIDTLDNIVLFFSSSITGLSTITVMATDTGNKSAVTTFNISVFDPASENKALLRKTSASSIENTGHYSVYSVDGDSISRWSTTYSDDQWFIVEMEQLYTIQRVFFDWEAAFGKVYDIQVSSDGENWETVFSETCGNGGKDLIVFDPVDAKFVKMDGNKRGTQWGYSFFEMEIYTTSITNNQPTVEGAIPDQSVDATTEFNFIIPDALFIDTDIENGDRLVFSAVLNDNSALPSWLTFDICTGEFLGMPENADSGVYQIKVIATDVFSETASTFFNLTVIPEEKPVLTEKNSMSEISVYPVSASEIINLNLPAGYYTYEVKMFDIIGSIVMNNNSIPSGLNLIEVGHLKQGAYLIKISVNNKEKLCRLIMIK